MRCGVRGRGATAAHAACMGMDRLKAGGQGTRGAHVEHLLHGRDLGRVEAERLVERLPFLCRVERWACDAGRGAAREV